MLPGPMVAPSEPVIAEIDPAAELAVKFADEISVVVGIVLVVC